MAKFKVGDVVKPLPSEDGYLHPYLIAGENYTVERYTSKGEVNVSGEFSENGDGRGWDADWFELVESKTTAEALRNSILNIRSKREALQKELLQLDEQEKEAVEKLKEQGFLLYEENVSKKALVTTNKAFLYAEDIEEDMTDPRNWEVGDLVESISETVPITLPFGSIQEVLGVTKSALRITDTSGSSVSPFDCVPKYFKFLARPVK